MKNKDLKVRVEDIVKVREESGAGIADTKSALEQALEQVKLMKSVKFEDILARAREMAKENLKKEGFDKAASKMGREVKSGMVEVYSHGGKVGVMVELLCETDFVAHTADFKNLAHELSLQIASMNPSSVEDLLKQEYIRDPSLSIDALIKSAISKLGENIQVGRFERIALGE